jgi:hypothetical protein
MLWQVGKPVYRKSAARAETRPCGSVKSCLLEWKLSRRSEIDKEFRLLNVDLCVKHDTLHNLLILCGIFPVVNQRLPKGFLCAKSDQENSCVRHKLSPCVEMPM